MTRGDDKRPATRIVDETVFRQVYDLPQWLPGEERWVTTDVDVRRIEDPRVFKCHNWAYTMPALLEELGRMRACGAM